MEWIRRLFESDEGMPSMNRILVFLGGVAGMAIVVAGIVHLFVSTDGQTTVVVIATGVAIFTGSQLIKNAGRKLENGR